MDEASQQLNRTLLGALLLGKIQQVPPSDLDEWQLNFQALRDMDHYTAIHILGYFPSPFLTASPTNHKAREAVALMQDFYQGIATWLFSDKLQTKVDTLSNTHWKSYEKFAILSNRRFQLVSALFNTYKSAEKEYIFGNPSFMWLLAESAVCRQMLSNSGLAYKPTNELLTKNKHYENTQQYINQIKMPGNPFSKKGIESLEEWFTYFDREVEVEGFKLATEDPKFDTKYYKPYMKARTQWNGECRNNPELKFIDVLQQPKTRRPNPQGMGKARKRK